MLYIGLGDDSRVLRYWVSPAPAWTLFTSLLRDVECETAQTLCMFLKKQISRETAPDPLDEGYLP